MMRLPISGSKISFAAVFLVSLCFSTLLMWKTTRSLDSYNTGGSKKRRRAGCSRDAAEFYIPTDLKTCKQPRKVDWFNDFLAKNLKNNPLEPGCWEANNSCAPFPCFKLCETGRYAELRKIWSPEKPGKQKVLAFQYGKAAAERNRDGLPASQDGSIQIILGDDCFIITATRSHFSRDPSEYFENILYPYHPYGFHPRGIRRYNDTPPVAGDQRWTQEKIMKLGKDHVEALQEDFHDQTSALFQDFQAQHEVVIQAYSKWYSGAFKSATDVDIMQQRFDPKKKHMLVHGERCRVLVLRFEDIGEWTNIIGQYFPGFKMPQGSNRAELKWYAEAYRNFLKTLSYRPEELKAMCETETETHFYAEDPDSECADADF